MLSPNYAFKPIAEEALRLNQTIAPQRLNAALGLGKGMTGILDRCAMTYFNQWLVEALPVDSNQTVKRVLDTLNVHAIASDGTSKDYFMPSSRYEESPGKFRIYGENQNIWYCFVAAGKEELSNPEVYFECEGDERGHWVICDDFRKFIWFMLARYICIRVVKGPHLRDGVSGALFARPVSVDDSFFNPIDGEFPDGFSCWVSESVVWIPHWGAAFLHATARENFIAKHAPSIRGNW